MAWSTKFVGDVCPDTMADTNVFEHDAHAVDVAVEIHGGGEQYALEGGPSRVTDHVFRQLYRQ